RAACLVPPALRAAEQREIRAQEHDLEAAPLRRDADVAAAWTTIQGRGLCEEAVVSIGTWRRKDVGFAAREQREQLLVGATHRRRRRDNLRTCVHTVTFARRERIDCRLVEADHRTERPRDEMQLVLDNEIWRL